MPVSQILRRGEQILRDYCTCQLLFINALERATLGMLLHGPTALIKVAYTLDEGYEVVSV